MPEEQSKDQEEKPKKVPLDKGDKVCFAAEAGICKGCAEEFSDKDLSENEKKTDEEIVKVAKKEAGVKDESDEEK